MNNLIQRTASGVAYTPIQAAVGINPQINLGAAALYSVTVSASAAAVINIRDGVDATAASPVRLTFRVPIGQSQTLSLGAARFSNGIFIEFVSGTGECTVEFGMS